MVSECLPSDALLQHLPSYLGFSYLGHWVSLHSCSSKAQPLLLTLDKGYLLTTTLSDLHRGITPLGPPVPAQPPHLALLLPAAAPGLGRRVAPPGCPWPRTWGNSSWPLPFGHGVLPASAPDLRLGCAGHSPVMPNCKAHFFFFNHMSSPSTHVKSYKNIHSGNANFSFKKMEAENWWCSVAKSCLTLCDLMDCSMPGFLYFTISWRMLIFLPIESVRLSNHLILCLPLLLLSSIFSSIRVLSNESALCIRWPKFWRFSIRPSN